MPFVVFFSPRTGSSHLASLLDDHPEIRCLSETFNPQGVYLGIHRPGEEPTDQPDLGPLFELRESDPIAFCNRVFELDEGRPQVGFKLFPEHNLQAAEYLAKTPDVKNIVLNRGNLLAVYSSELRAASSGEWNRRIGNQPVETPKPTFDADDFEAYCETHIARQETLLRWMRESGNDAFIVEYGDIGDRALMDDIADFLGVSPFDRAPETVFEKQNSPDIVSRFSNPADVECWLRYNRRCDWAFDARQLSN